MAGRPPRRAAPAVLVVDTTGEGLYCLSMDIIISKAAHDLAAAMGRSAAEATNNINQALASFDMPTEAEGNERYCATCGNPEGSPYAGRCCTDDNMID